MAVDTDSCHQQFSRNVETGDINISGSLPIKKKVRADAPLDEFKAHMDERITALMKQYSIPGCNIALVKDNEIVWTECYGYADVASGTSLMDAQYAHECSIHYKICYSLGCYSACGKRLNRFGCSGVTVSEKLGISAIGLSDRKNYDTAAFKSHFGDAIG